MDAHHRARGLGEDLGLDRIPHIWLRLHGGIGPSEFFSFISWSRKDSPEASNRIAEYFCGSMFLRSERFLVVLSPLLLSLCLIEVTGILSSAFLAGPGSLHSVDIVASASS